MQGEQDRHADRRDQRDRELAGDRWSLLVIRDLLTGTKRFTDLMDRLGGITPKTLSQRLHELSEAGIVIADREPGRREVWYCLTPAGEELRPASGDHEPARWHFRLDDADYLVESDGQHWSLRTRVPSGPADVTVTGTALALRGYIFAEAELDVAGDAGQVERFRHLLRTLPAIVGQPDAIGQPAV